MVPTLAKKCVTYAPYEPKNRYQYCREIWFALVLKASMICSWVWGRGMRIKLDLFLSPALPILAQVSPQISYIHMLGRHPAQANCLTRISVLPLLILHWRVHSIASEPKYHQTWPPILTATGLTNNEQQTSVRVPCEVHTRLKSQGPDHVWCSIS